MLEIRNLSYVTPEGKVILDDINLTVKNRFTAVTGPNGSGKSTLARVIAGIINPTTGSIILDGEDITGMSITERARNGVSFAFQQPVRFKGITVRDIISIAAGRELSLDEACEYLSEVGLCARDYIDREINESLSGGELKRIEIATAFARSTRLTLFDEPEAGIDLWSFQSLIKVFERMYEKTNGSIIIISHQPIVSYSCHRKDALLVSQASNAHLHTDTQQSGRHHTKLICRLLGTTKMQILLTPPPRHELLHHS